VVGMDREHTWALVLAAGAGRRLQSLTSTGNGYAVPKQFCSLNGGRSLLHAALQRAWALVPPARTCTIVAAEHRHWWAGHLAALPAANVIIQPANRGTANGVLLPLLQIIARDPQARVVLLPSDHYVHDEAKLTDTVSKGVARLGSSGDGVLLLGIEPDEPDSELGYILPGQGDGFGTYNVERFVEKPPTADAIELIRKGGLWNAFIIAGSAGALLRLFARRCPDVVMQMRRALDRYRDSVFGRDAIIELYQELPELDFSRHVLEGQERFLRVLPVPRCGWTDLGTPARVASVLEGLARARRSPVAATGTTGYLDLATQYRFLQGAHNARTTRFPAAAAYTG
jgi:mannose-1-phosphate guanylyltransferase